MHRVKKGRGQALSQADLHEEACPTCPAASEHLESLVQRGGEAHLDGGLVEAPGDAEVLLLEAPRDAEQRLDVVRVVEAAVGQAEVGADHERLLRRHQHLLQLEVVELRRRGAQQPGVLPQHQPAVHLEHRLARHPAARARGRQRRRRRALH
eukprot:scaffold32847_cov63-Phaeocystis_antarctica.AAC.1